VSCVALAIAGLFPAVMPAPSAWGAEQDQASSTDGASSGSTTGASTLQEFLRGTSEGISANPGATNVLTGTGLLGRLLGFGPDSGVRLGGLWIGDMNYLVAGGADPRTWSFNSLLLVDFSLDLEKLLRIPGAQIGAEFLQFNGQNTNGQAGVVAGTTAFPARRRSIATSSTSSGGASGCSTTSSSSESARRCRRTTSTTWYGR
jgi:hypothetical protein